MLDTALLFPAIRRAMLLVYCADALSMPAHWFYNPSDITRFFGPAGIRDMVAAPERHPSSIMRLHSTSGGGRSSVAGKKDPEVVGSVILKGKAHLWGRPEGHYHHGMPAGENTLNAYCARMVWRDVLTPLQGVYSQDAFLDRYIAMMTSDEAMHPDTYAESFHRGFFANLVHKGLPRTQCGAVTHDTPSVGGLVMVAPIALSLLAVNGGDVPTTQRIARQHVALTHPDATLAKVCDEYVELLGRLMRPQPGDSSEAVLLRAASKWIKPPSPKRGAAADDDLDALKAYVASTDVGNFIGRVVSPACYITDSWPAILFMAAKFANDDPVAALRFNTNAGGENCHRGSVLGSILGLTDAARRHADAVDALAGQLRHSAAINKELELWQAAVAPRADL